MDWTTALAVALGLTAVATLVGVVTRSRSGRVRATRVASGASGTTDASGEADGTSHPLPATAAAGLGLTAADLGEGATLVQFSTEYCSRCPATARSLGELASEYGIRHVEVDLTHDAVLADRFHVVQTPTTLVLDGSGTQVARIGGVPRLPELRALLDSLTRRPHVSH